jgi:hypothetical protein
MPAAFWLKEPCLPTGRKERKGKKEGACGAAKSLRRKKRKRVSHGGHNRNTVIFWGYFFSGFYLV